MKIAYYPGCTMKTRAASLELAAIEALNVLGVEFTELERWNCCGAVFSLAEDDLIHHVAPVRNLIRAQQEGCDTVVTICSQCYNTLARANLLVRGDQEKLDTINRFMDEEPDYGGGIEVIHYLTLLRDVVGWDALKAKVVRPLGGLRVAPFYGCTLLRPDEVSIDPLHEGVLEQFLRALGAEPVAHSAATECCGSYQMLAHPEEGLQRAAKVIGSANHAGAEALVLSCPLCEYNLGTRQPEVVAMGEALKPVPTLYFTQLLGIALGLEPDLYRLDLAGPSARNLLVEKNFVAAATV
jgi:heterodisulfide reductase subunit B